ncbi:MAG TPA: HAD-IIIA family hydrolase, partial [Candidatus Binataceae bacterium]|nr:HAD-IIIA family hydrolase [Candidatus Binataceae bacterium]
NAALFLDLAGTLVELDDSRNIPRNSRGDLIIKLLPNVADKLAPMHDHLMLVVTNQAGVNRKWFTMEQVEDAMRALDDQLGGILTGWQICPHTPDDNCECRKPKAGMITDLAELYGVDLRASTMVGDQEVDELAAEAAGVGRFIYARDFFGWD